MASAILRVQHHHLVDQVHRLRRHLAAWDRILKISRTHLADATPIRLGQEFSGFARPLELSVRRAESAIQPILELPIGGTPRQFSENVWITTTTR